MANNSDNPDKSIFTFFNDDPALHDQHVIGLFHSTESMGNH